MVQKPKPTIAKVPLKPLGPDSTPYEKNLDEMRECASAVGNLCFAWAALEHMLDKLISSMLEVSDERRADTILANMNQREKFRTALHLGFLRRLSDEWFDALKWCIDQTNHKLRERRNRIVHGLWHVSSTGILLIKAVTGIERPQEGDPLYFTSEESPVSKDNVQELTKEVQHMIIRLDALWRAGAAREDWKTSLSEQGLLPPRKAG